MGGFFCNGEQQKNGVEGGEKAEGKRERERETECGGERESVNEIEWNWIIGDGADDVSCRVT